MIRHALPSLLAVFLATCVGAPPQPCTVCDEKCVDLKTDVANCGMCGQRCAAGRVCTDGACKDTCPGTQVVCGGKCVDTQSDNAHCGGCGTACAAGSVCASGVCAASCAMPLEVCNDACVDLRGNTSHCGMCGRVCAPMNASAATCTAGQCGYKSCNLLFSSCDGRDDNGCETDTSSDVLNCGGCNVVCRPVNVMKRPVAPPDAGADAGVDGGTDAGTDAGIDAGFVVDAGPVDAGPPCGTLADGGSTTPCPLQPPAQGTTCVNATCDYEVCLPGYADCDGIRANGCEASLENDPKNCGACRRSCTGAGETCSDFACNVPRGSFLSPRNEIGYSALQSSSPRQMHFNLVPEPGATLHYTTDGTTPRPGQAGTMSSTTPVGFDLNFALLKWYASFPDGRREPLRQYGHAINPDVCQRSGIIENFRFTSSGNAVAVVNRGATVTGAFSQQFWISQSGCYCPGCVTQWVLGIDGVGQIACAPAGGTYPGTSLNSTFSFTAPMTPGRYIARWGATDQFTCASHYPGGTNVGLLIVQ